MPREYSDLLDNLSVYSCEFPVDTGTVDPTGQITVDDEEGLYFYKDIDYFEFNGLRFFNGDNVKVIFNVGCNEWKGKYFTSLSAWRIEKADIQEPAKVDVEEEEDLPF